MCRRESKREFFPTMNPFAVRMVRVVFMVVGLVQGLVVCAAAGDDDVIRHSLRQTGLTAAAPSDAHDSQYAAIASALMSATQSKLTETELAPGIRHLHWHIAKSELQPGPWNLNTLVIDISRPDVSVRIVPSNGKSERTSEICKRVGAVAGVNGGFFDANGPLGLLMQAGEIVHSTGMTKEGRATFALGGRKAWLDVVSVTDGQLLPQNTHPYFDWQQAHEALSAGPRIVFKGRVDVNAEAEGFDEHTAVQPDVAMARTAVGLARDTLVLVSVDAGEDRLSIGMPLKQIAGFLLSRCMVSYAMALDGGDSTTFVVQDSVVNYPSGKDAQGKPWNERPVANAICVFSQEEER
jgi:exopolysaccharide biosynthesis protein